MVALLLLLKGLGVEALPADDTIRFGPITTSWHIGRPFV